MKKVLTAVFLVGVVAAGVVAASLWSLDARTLALYAASPEQTWVPETFVWTFAERSSHLNPPQPNAPVTLLQFTLNAYPEQRTETGRHRVLRLAELLLRKGHDINALDDQGLASVHHAVLERSPQLLQFLADHGADLNRRSAKGETPLAFARSLSGRLLDRRQKPAYDAVIAFLLQNGAKA